MVLASGLGLVTLCVHCLLLVLAGVAASSHSTTAASPYLNLPTFFSIFASPFSSPDHGEGPGVSAVAEHVRDLQPSPQPRGNTNLKALAPSLGRFCSVGAPDPPPGSRPGFPPGGGQRQALGTALGSSTGHRELERGGPCKASMTNQSRGSGPVRAGHGLASPGQGNI